MTKKEIKITIPDVETKEPITETEIWESTSVACPFCAVRNVWSDTYSYVGQLGTPFICLSCDRFFYIPVFGKCETEYDKERLLQLKHNKEREEVIQ